MKFYGTLLEMYITSYEDKNTNYEKHLHADNAPCTFT